VPAIALIVNPHAGSGRRAAPEAGDLAERLRALGARVEVFERDDLGGAADWRPERIGVVGGDGTIGPVAAAAGRLGVPLAMIPAGTANDFVRALDLPADPDGACRLAALGTQTRRVDLGWMDGHPWVNAASAGLAVPAARRAAPLKPFLGPVAYLAGALHAGMTGSPLRCTVRCDGHEIFHGQAWQVIVANTGAFGGGSDIEAAEPEDARLDATVIPAGSRAGLVLRGYGLRSGRITRQHGIRHTGARTVHLDVPADTAYNVDGELVTAGPAHFRLDPRAFEVIVG
jgi:diacylglycerol kinase (ATP)